MKIHILLISLMLLFSFSATEYKGFDSIEPVITYVDEDFEKDLRIEYKESIYQSFVNRVGQLESSNDYQATNGSYYGKYQFGQMALKDIGFDHIDMETFMNTPEFQEEAMRNWLRINKQYLKRYIDKYEGTTHRGIFITEAGMLASAHLGGSTSVKIWFDTGRVFRDGNGTPITKYMREFEDLKDFKLGR